jgi:hypothetical protein
MGRTLPTFNSYLEHEIEQWRPFRRALRRDDQAVFDRLFVFARRHMAEAASVARPVPFDSLLMAVLLEQQKEIERLKELAGENHATD